MSEIATYYVISKISKRELHFDKRFIRPSHSPLHDKLIHKCLEKNFQLSSIPNDRYFLNFNANKLKSTINFLEKGGFANKPILLNGLVHAFPLFYEYKDDIFKLFEDFLPTKKVEEKIAFHFRLGDFCHHCPNMIISDKYIHGAILGMLERGAPREIDLFTENPNIARRRLSKALEMEPKIANIKINFIHGDDLEDFKSMAGYKYFISSWSSYSWWSLFLGINLSKDRIISIVRKGDFNLYKNQFCPKS